MADRKDPYANYNFIVDIEGIAVAGVREVTGLESAIDVIDYREGSDNSSATRKLPGRVKYSVLTLKTGVTNDSGLYKWHREWVTNPINAKRVTIRIALRDRSGADVRSWVIREAWPSKWIGPTLNAEGHGVAMETLEITHEGIDQD